MFKKSMLLGVILATSSTTIVLPQIAWAGEDSARITKVEERLSDLEARVAKNEAAMHKQMGMMEHGHGKSEMGMGSPMGQAPQAAPAAGMGSQMPPAGAPAAGGMGDDM